MDILARPQTPIYPPSADDEFVTKKYVDEHLPTLTGAPQVMRVQVSAGSPSGGGGGVYTPYLRITLQLDRPAPANCFVQFWRNKRIGFISNKNKIASGFRAIGHHGGHGGPAYGAGYGGNTGGFPIVAIPQGQNFIDCGTIVQLFRPPKMNRSGSGYLNSQSRYYRQALGPPNSELPVWMTWGYGPRSTICTLKFGTILRYRESVNNYWIEQKGPPSTETIRIMRWKYNWGWGFKVDAM